MTQDLRAVQKASTEARERKWAMHAADNATEQADDEDEPVDDYGNPLSGDRLINCCFPDCGCDGARLCMAENGASSSARFMNFERGTFP